MIVFDFTRQVVYEGYVSGGVFHATRESARYRWTRRVPRFWRWL